MNHIKKFCVLVSTALIGAFASAQSNPGYLGNTQVLEVSTNWYISGLAAHGPWLKNHTSIAYEKSRNKNFSWRGGLRFGSGEFSGADHLGDFYVYQEDQWGSYQSTDPSGGTLGYSLTEFFIAPRWYNNNAGAIAPFGNFFGLEFAYSTVGITDNLVWSGRSIELPKITQGFSALSMAFQWGHRRVLFDKLCWDYHMGIGFNLFNTGNASIAYIEDGTDNSDHEAVVQSMVLQPLQWGRLFHGGIGISYLF